MPAASLVDGLALAATLKADREGVMVSRGLTGDAGEALAARLRSLRSLAGREREHALGAIIASLRPAVSPDSVLPPRAAALLATEVPRRNGAAWIASAPLPRRGYRASTALRASLRRLAVCRSDVDEALAARDRDEGRELLLEITRGADALDRASLIAALAPDERTAIATRQLAGPSEPSGSARPGDPARESPERADGKNRSGRADSWRVSEPVDGPHRARRIAFAQAAVASGAAHELCEALGGMERGARGEGDDRWARAGRECAAMWEHMSRVTMGERACRE